MERHQRELLVARVCSGRVRLRLPGRGGRERSYLLLAPTPLQRYDAAEVYAEALHEAQLEGLYSDADLMAFLLEQGFWDEERDKLLVSLPKEIENFKVSLFQATFKSNERKTIRKALAVAKAKLGELLSERHAFDHLCCAGSAAAAKARFLAASCLHSAAGRRVFGGGDFSEADTSLLDEVMAAHARVRIDEASFRELARTDPWRPVWNAHRVEGSVFGGPPCAYSEEQIALVNWSMLYDNVAQHPNCPPDAVVNDDDLLDGWMIVQRRERDKAGAGADELVANEKIRNSQEVYMVAETIEDARQVVDLNDDYAKAVQRRRFEVLRKKGEVDEIDMPDTKQRLRMEVTAALSRSMAQGK